MLQAFRKLTPAQRRTFLAALGGWSLDAFDFFLFVFCLKAISADFHCTVKAVAEGIFLTLAFRPLGALVFGWLAEQYGRRPVLMANILCYSAIELACAFAPDLATLLVLRALFGFAMGGEWGVGAALAFETLPARGRGFFSGLLQEGYALGFLLASLAFWAAFDHVGWRGMFVLGASPALLVLYIRVGVEESPAWLAGHAPGRASAASMWRAVRGHWPVLAFMVLLMACFNAFSHGSQDLYPTLLQVQRGFDTATTSRIAVVMNLGALCGGICFGVLSERLGRRRTIALAALLVLPVLLPWGYAQAPGLIALGAFLVQFGVQGAWGIVPAHLNELSPPAARAILPGLAYQLGNLAMSRLAPFQAGLAEARGNDYGAVLVATLAVVAVALALCAWAGPERHSRELRLSD
jgi:SHS family lactate transporter-like MFS transporter